MKFLSGGTVYQFKALCFGLSATPQVFTRVFAAISAWAHSHWIRLLRYRDDGLVLASSESEAKKNVQDLLLLCHSLGIVINEEKSDLVPLQTVNYLGMTIDTGATRIFPSLAQVKKFLSVATLQHILQKSGFSRGSVIEMSGCVRTSTSHLYQAKWMLFCGWCRGRGVAPVNDTIPLIVDFLVHLRLDKGLSVLTIKGYQSALNSVFVLKGMDLADSHEISMLLRSFSKSARPEELRLPTWDVTLILQSLTRAPYEPLLTLDECLLAQKMLFLLALASAKRVGELHTLLYRVSHSRDWGEVSFSFIAGFVAMTQDPSS